MEENQHPGTSDDHSDGQTIPASIKAYVDEQVEKSKEKQRDTKKKRWKNAWRSASPITKGTFIGTVAVAVATVVYAFIAYFQLKAMKGQLEEMKGSGAQTSQMMCLYQQQLAQITKQANDTHDLAVAAGNQAGESKTLAAATKSAADTAKQALHVSERAYISIQGKAVEWEQHVISMSLVNTGRIPSGDVFVTERVAVYSAAVPFKMDATSDQVEISRYSQSSSPLSNGDRPSLNIPIPTLDRAQIESGRQGIYIIGTAQYSDGFPGTKLVKTPFCIYTNFSTVSGQVALSPCDAKLVLPDLERMQAAYSKEHKDE